MQREHSFESLSTTKTIVMYANLEIRAFTPRHCVSDVSPIALFKRGLYVGAFYFFLMHNALCFE